MGTAVSSRHLFFKLFKALPENGPFIMQPKGPFQHNWGESIKHMKVF